MDYYKQKVFNKFKKVAENVIPTLKTNKFQETGMLTVEEFITAGDFLVSKYPMWAWESSKSKKHISYLPKHKQMLVLLKVPCVDNIILETETAITDNENWSMLTDSNQKKQQNNTENQKTTEDTTKETTEELDTIDLEIMMEESLSDDDDEVFHSTTNILKTKTYDISITYDNYYRTPRIWFMGYDKYGYPLSYDKMARDISNEHNNITATINTHPFYNIKYISVHPCKHSHIMKRFMQYDEDKEISVEHYFLYFLKFVSCILPNLEFDFTS